MTGAVHIQHYIPAASYESWLLVALAQLITLIRVARQERLASLYLAGELLLNVVGIPASLLLPLASFRALFTWCGLADDFLTAVLLFGWLDELRLRARKKYRSTYAVAAVGALTGLAVYKLSDLPLAELDGHPLRVAYTLSHLSWTWLSTFFATIPLYCLVTGAIPSKRLLLLLAGLGLYLAGHVGVVDYLIVRHFRNSEWASVFSSTTYLLTLYLWTKAPSVPKAEHRLSVSTEPKEFSE